jgi:hypothetical protein
VLGDVDGGAKDGGGTQVDGGAKDDGGASGDAPASPICTPNQALRCDNDNLVRCNNEGTAEISESCAIGCNTAQLRCNEVNPSNELAPHLDVSAGEPDLDLGTSATLNTDDGTVIVDGAPRVVRSATVAQTAAPNIRVFIVQSLIAKDVRITGKNALAIVSNGDLKIGGLFTASARTNTAGAGRFNDAACTGGDQISVTRGLGGTGGGGFGGAGGRGGSATNGNGTATGGRGGTAVGNAVLVPLRGGCDSGAMGGLIGAGGGAIQLVSRTQITISGVVAVNGSSSAGGGSGGGILLEAPIVEASGKVVANGGAGAGGCLFPPVGEDGRLDATPATAGLGCAASGGVNGGNGAAGNLGAVSGANVTLPGDTSVFGGHGGGGLGRVRVNTRSGGLRATGLFSPNPSTGTLATR